MLLGRRPENIPARHPGRLAPLLRRHFVVKDTNRQEFSDHHRLLQIG
jgi:hypothetical protein